MVIIFIGCFFFDLNVYYNTYFNFVDNYLKSVFFMIRNFIFIIIKCFYLIII